MIRHAAIAQIKGFPDRTGDLARSLAGATIRMHSPVLGARRDGGAGDADIAEACTDRPTELFPQDRQRRTASTASPCGARPLQPGYLDSVEQCASANDCPWCQLILTQQRASTRSYTVMGPFGPNPVRSLLREKSV